MNFYEIGPRSIFRPGLTRSFLHRDPRVLLALGCSLSGLVNSRPGTIRVFMYPGRVYSFRAGTRLPASQRLAQKSWIFAAKARWKQIKLSKLSHIGKRDVPKPYLSTLIHTKNHCFLEFIYYYYLFIMI